MVFHLDSLGDGVLLSADGHLGGGVGQGNGTLDGVTPGDKVAGRLVGRLNLITVGGDGLAGHLGVAVLVGENENTALDGFFDAGVQSFQLTQSLVDGHGFSSHSERTP